MLANKLSTSGASVVTATDILTRTRQWFETGGPLEQALENYNLRQEQLEMAEAVALALQDKETLIVEAGTGIGKSLAYLVPSILSGGKIIVSTGTKNLQDQLFNKDIPLLTRLIKRPVNVSLLKGRANYLCFHRLGQAIADPRLHKRKSNQTQSPWLTLRSLKEWGLQSEDGDLNASDAPKVDSIPLARVTSTTENCLGSECPDYSECFVIKARRRAQEADVVVVNHHLLLADLALREEGFVELLPEADAVILDEAHQLPQIATQFFGRRFSFYQLSEIARDIRAEVRDIAVDMPALRDCLADYEEACADMQHRLSGNQTRMTWIEMLRSQSVVDCVSTFNSVLERLSEALEPAKVRSKGLEKASRRVTEMQEFFRDIQSENVEFIRWAERSDRNFILYLTPLDVAENFRNIMESTHATWVLTSATLSVNKSFEHFVSQIGAEKARTLMLDSPFDFEKNALLYLPGISREPNHPAYSQSVADAIQPIIKSAKGGAFVLCTSVQAVNYLTGFLRTRLGMNVLAQGEAGKHALLEQFKSDGNAVLVGTSSFWEGVDVQGDALRLVIIDKLPFAHPGDPVMRARLDAIKQNGGSPFFDYQVPQAVIALKQGVGRLIRDVNDRGVVMLCDPRLTTKGYGRTFLDSLPDMPRVNTHNEVEAFMQLVDQT